MADNEKSSRRIAFPVFCTVEISTEVRILIPKMSPQYLMVLPDRRQTTPTGFRVSDQKLPRQSLQPLRRRESVTALETYPMALPALPSTIYRHEDVPSQQTFQLDGQAAPRRG